MRLPLSQALAAEIAPKSQTQQRCLAAAEEPQQRRKAAVLDGQRRGADDLLFIKYKQADQRVALPLR